MTEPYTMKPSWRYRAGQFVRRHASVLAVLLVGLIAVVAIGGTVIESRARDRADDKARDERLAQICESIESNRQGLLDLIDVVLQDNAEPSAEPDLDALPEFRAVDPEVQDLVRVLVEPSGGSGGSVRDRLRGFRDGLLSTPLPEFCPTERGGSRPSDES